MSHVIFSHEKVGNVAYVFVFAATVFVLFIQFASHQIPIRMHAVFLPLHIGHLLLFLNVMNEVFFGQHISSLNTRQVKTLLIATENCV